MADDSNLMTLEHDDGTAPTPPPDPTPDPAAPEPAATPDPEPQAAAPAEVPDPQPGTSATPTNPQAAGLLRELQQTRERERQWREVAQAGVQLAQRIDSDPKLKAAVYGRSEPAQTASTPTQADEPVAPRHVLEQIARQNVWYDKDGQPDLVAAGNFLQMVDQRAASHAERIVNERLAPLQRNQTQQAATGRRAEVMQVAQQVKIPQETAALFVDGLMQTNPEMIADPATATMTLLAAAGYHYLQQQGASLPGTTPAPTQPQQPRQPAPTFVEQGQGARPATPVMSSLEQTIAKRAGVKPQAWQQSIDRMANTTPSRSGFRAFSSEEDS